MTFGTLSTSYGVDCAKPKPLASDMYVVPINKSFGYSALTHQQPYRSTVYFNIAGAYPSSCTTFGYRKAEGNTVIRGNGL
jgi:hypothetical protein